MPKFLKSRADLDQYFSRLGRACQSGEISESGRRTYRMLAEWMRDSATAKRHIKWQRLYDETYGTEKSKNLANGMSPKKAMFQAHLKAQAKVATVFNVTERQVRKAINLYD